MSKVKVRTEKQKSFFIEIAFLLFEPISSPTFRIHTARVECPTFELPMNLMIFSEPFMISVTKNFSQFPKIAIGTFGHSQMKSDAFRFQIA